MTALRYMICMLLAAGSLSSTAEITQTRLGTQVAAPLRGASEKIWNLSTVIADEEAGVSYRVYGDTVVSEEYDAIRCWYATDSQGLLRMESSLWRVDPLAPVGAGVWAPISAEATENFNGAIARESMPDDTLACSLTRQADMAGLVVLPGPDTLRAVLRSEAIGVRDAGGEYVRETRRWFAAGDSRACPVPVAMAGRRGGRAGSRRAPHQRQRWPSHHIILHATRGRSKHRHHRPHRPLIPLRHHTGRRLLGHSRPITAARRTVSGSAHRRPPVEKSENLTPALII